MHESVTSRGRQAIRCENCKIWCVLPVRAVMIRHIDGLQISSPLESRRLDMLFMLELRTGFD